MFDPPDELLERLRSPNVTPDDVMEFLLGQYYALDDAPYPDQFFTGQADLDQYRAAVAWWPKGEHVPPQLAAPTVWQLCTRYEEQDPRIGATFLARLTLRANAVVTWIQQQGGDPANPSETPSERRKRQNREAQKRHRVRGTDTPAGAHERAVAEAYKAYMDICAQRRIALAAWDAKVAEARHAWETIKNKPAE